MIGIRILGAVGCFLAGALLAIPATAQNLTAANPQALANVLRGEGVTNVVVKTDKEGDPMIDASLGDNAKFTIFFYDCTNNRNCQAIQFYAGYTDSKMDPDKLNTWNRTKRFGRAYIDKVGDPVVVMDVDMNDGGMSRDLFIDNFQFWQSIMSEYSKFVYAD